MKAALFFVLLTSLGWLFYLLADSPMMARIEPEEFLPRSVLEKITPEEISEIRMGLHSLNPQPGLPSVALAFVLFSVSALGLLEGSWNKTRATEAWKNVH